MVVITDYLDIKSIKFRNLVDGEPIIIISNGKLLNYNLKKVRITINKLMAQLSTYNVSDAKEVFYAGLNSADVFYVSKKTKKKD